MKQHRLLITKVLFVTCLSGIAIGVSSQEVVATAGSQQQANGIQINFTVGQLVNGTESSSNIGINQGFHQVFEDVVEALDVPNEKNQINVFPNPTSTTLTIRSEEPSTIYYTLYDLNGAKVATGDFKEVTQLAINQYAKGMYQLILTNDEEQLLETFKVQFK